VNFVSRAGDGCWRYRTYERGVEAETLACGSGAVATAILLAAWAEVMVPGTVGIETRSKKPLRITLRLGDGGWSPSLSGEGRVVFEGMLSEI
jgi:diaminopimelate epimerase